jgi:hypothetical protein
MAVPVTDLIIAAVSKLVDDSQAERYREPSHSDIDFYVGRVGLSSADPKAQGQTVGKAKRVRAILSWAVDNDPDAAGNLIESLISKIRGSGGFRPGSPNFVGQAAITNAIEAFGSEGYALASDGDLRPKNLDVLHGRELTAALKAYANRARRGAEDAALLAGTSKDLLEATAAHVLVAKYGQYPDRVNFPTLLGQAFIAIGLATPAEKTAAGELAHKPMERALYESACAVNRLRNKEGTGHGRPWVSGLRDPEVQAAVRVAGCVAAYMLDKLEDT